MKKINKKSILKGLLMSSLLVFCLINFQGCKMLDSKSQKSANHLNKILDAQSDEVKARYQYRKPAEVLAFFEVKPGTSIVEAMPGGGWYTQILAPYLGKNGKILAINYPMSYYENWRKKGSKSYQDFLVVGETWTQKHTKADSAQLSAIRYNQVSSAMKNSADTVIAIRAIHGLNVLGKLDSAASDYYNLLKPGGILGIVQHKAPENNENDWAIGKNGYVKESQIRKTIEKAGFEFIASSDMLINPLDQPTEKDNVWRLPPALSNSKDNPKLRAEMKAIGESSRMVLKFRKPIK